MVSDLYGSFRRRFGDVSPVGIFGVAGRLARDGVLEDLTAVDLLLHRTARDQAVHHHIAGLSNAEGAVHRLGVRGRVPAGVVCALRHKQDSYNGMDNFPSNVNCFYFSLFISLPCFYPLLSLVFFFFILLQN